MPGVSNYCIFDQLKTAISIKPDLIIFNTTAPERFEITLECANIFSFYDLYIKFPILKYFHTQYNWYKKIFETDEVIPFLISTGSGDMSHVSGLANSIRNDLEKKVVQTLKNKKEDIMGYLNLTDYFINKDYDKYLLNGVLSEIIDQKIPYICVMDLLELNHKSFNMHNNILNHKEVMVEVEAENKSLGLTFKDVPHYHTIQSRQYEFAKIVFNSMKNLNLLSNNLDFDSNTI